MTVEELMIPRVQVMMLYPDWRFNVGSILTRFMNQGAMSRGFMYKDAETLGTIHDDTVEAYPHIFRPLAWYEHRKKEDMPEYIKHIPTGIVMSANFNIMTDNYFDILEYPNGDRTVEDGKCYVVRYCSKYLPDSNIYDFTPATEQEYNDFIKK